MRWRGKSASPTSCASAWPPSRLWCGDGACGAVPLGGVGSRCGRLPAQPPPAHCVLGALRRAERFLRGVRKVVSASRRGKSASPTSCASAWPPSRLWCGDGACGAVPLGGVGSRCGRLPAQPSPARCVPEPPLRRAERFPLGVLSVGRRGKSAPPTSCAAPRRRASGGRCAVWRWCVRVRCHWAAREVDAADFLRGRKAWVPGGAVPILRVGSRCRRLPAQPLPLPELFGGRS